MATFKDRLRELRDERDLTLEQLSNEVNITQATLSRYENGHRKPDIDIANTLSGFFNVSLDYLYGNTNIKEPYKNYSDEIIKEFDENQDRIIGVREKIVELKTEISNMEKNPEFFNPESYKTNQILLKDYEKDLEYRLQDNHFTKEGLRATMKGLSEQLIPFKKLNPNKLMVVPIVGTVRAGEPIFAEQNIEGYFPIDKEFTKSGKEYFYLKIVGDSMDEEFKEGSMVLVEHQTHNYIENGKIGVVLIDGLEATVKKIIINDSKITLIPCSSNAEHEIKTYDIEKDEVRIIGRVVVSIKNY